MENEILIMLITVIGLMLPMIGVKFGVRGLQIIVVFLTLTTAIFSGKMIKAFGLIMSSGVPLFAAIFLSTDLIGELYGKKRGFETIIISLCSNLCFLIIGICVVFLVPFGDSLVSGAIDNLFTFIPRLFLGSLIAFIVSQILDIILFSKLKKVTKGKYLWLRNCLSTSISQFVDTFLIVFIVFWKVLPINGLVDLFISIYIVKLVIVLIDTPFCYWGRKIAQKE